MTNDTTGSGHRGCIIIRDSDTAVVLYAHWGGEHLAQIVREGLEAGHSRWDHPAYLARIIFDSMTAGESRLTGYGLSAWPTIPDNERPFLVVDCDTRRVGYVDDEDISDDEPPRVRPGIGWSFDEVIAGSINGVQR